MENLNQNENIENSENTSEKTEGLENLATANDQLERLIQSDQLERYIQSKVDMYLAKERKEKAELRKQLEDLKKLKLNEDELKQLEFEEQARMIADRENSIRERENRLYAVKAIKAAGLDDGSETSFDLVDVVLSEDTAKIDAKIKIFKKYIEKTKKTTTEGIYKANGSTPAKGSNLNMGDNPYSKENFNFTAQMRLEAENPELAAQLRAAAGIK